MHGARGALRVSSRESDGNAFQGGPTRVALAPDGVNLQYESEFVSFPGTSLLTTYWAYLADAYSYAYRDAAPQGDVTLIDPPSMASPQPIYGVLSMQSESANGSSFVEIARDDSSIVWRVFDQGMGSAALRMRKLPSAIDPRTVLGTGRITARPAVCRRDASTGRCSELAVGAAVDLVSG
jgi:hypothetical protein